MRSRKKVLILLVISILLLVSGNCYAGRYTQKVSDVLEERRHQNVMSDTVHQQIVNGTYRTVDMLAIVAAELDRDEQYKSKIADVLEARRHQNVMSDTVYQQAVNGTYRTVDMLAILANILDS